MHQKRWSNHLKKAISLTLVSAILVPTLGFAENQRQMDSLNQIRTIEKDISDRSNISETKIDRNIDITSQEEVSVIVQFNSPALAQSNELNKSKSSLQKDIKNDNDKFKEHLNKLKKEKSASDYKINYEYNTVFNGVSITLKGTEVEKLLESGVVKRIYENKMQTLELPEQEKVKSTPQTKMNDSVPHIGVDKLHREGIKGEGVKVGVLDTGIDYNHPDLKDNYKGSTSAEEDYDKVKGWDFIGDDADPMETTYDDYLENGGEPGSSSPYYTSHGTHVAGTIAANGASKGEGAVVGVAPEVDLYGYRVLGPYGSGANDGIIAGVEKSVLDGMDVINLSLGADANAPDSPLAIACNNAMLAGVVTVVANGNAGPGIGTVGTPAAATLPISVGASSTSIKLETFGIKTANNNVSATLFAKDYKTGLSDFTSKEYNMVDVGEGAPSDYEGKDVSGKIALVKRGNFPLVEKVSNAKKAGAVGVIIYNNIDGPINYYVGESVDYVPSVEIDLASGEKLVEELKGNPDLKINLALTGTIGTEGDKLADFSSRGPVLNGDIKPDVVAPGVNIRSTYPEYMNDKTDEDRYDIAYARISGTSMASPHVAGVAALIVENYKDNKKDFEPQDVKIALMNTAEDLNGDYGVNEMGAGRVNAYDAVHPGVKITYDKVNNSLDASGNDITLNQKIGSVSLGIIEKSDKDVVISDELSISNNENYAKTLETSVEFVSASESHGGLDAVANGIKVDITSKVVINKNKSGKFKFDIKIPKNAEQGLYQGYINIKVTKGKDKDENETYQIPFSFKYLEGGINTAGIESYAINANPDMYHPWSVPGLPGWLSVNTPVEKIEFVVKDFDDKKDLGITTSYPGEWFVPGVEYSINSVMDYVNLSYYPMDENGNVKSIKEPIKPGKYIFEYRATEKDGTVTSRQFPLLVDGESADITVDEITPGVYELKASDFKEDVDPSTGETHNAYWIKGNVKDSGIQQLQEMGVQATNQHNKVSVLLNGIPQPGFSLHVDENGDFKAGITEEDLEKNTSLGLVPIDVARTYPAGFPQYTFVRKGTPYMNVDIKADTVTPGEEYTATVDFNNIDSISDFNIRIDSIYGVRVKDAKLTEAFESSLPEGYKATLKSEPYENEWWGRSELTLTLNVTDASGKKANINIDDKSVVEITYEIVDEQFMNMGEIYARPNMYMSTFNKVSATNTPEKVNILSKEIFDMVKLNKKQSTADIINIVESTAFSYNDDVKQPLEKYIKVIDDKGVSHPVEYDPFTQSYILKSIAPSTEAYTIEFNVPGHFKKVGKYIPSMSKNGEVYGKFTVIGSGIFNGVALAGDTNGDDAIDIEDAKAVAAAYGKTDSKEILGKDINFDGRVNNADMKYIVTNFLKVNSQNENAKAVGTKAELDEILKSIGYTK